MERQHARLTWQQWLDRMRARYNDYRMEATFRQGAADHNAVRLTFKRKYGTFASGLIFLRDPQVHAELMEVILDAGYVLETAKPRVNDYPETNRRATVWAFKNRGYWCEFELSVHVPPAPKVNREYLQTAPVGTIVTDEEMQAAGFRPYGNYFQVAGNSPLLLSHIGPNPTREDCALEIAVWEQCWRGQRRDDGGFGLKEGTIETVWKRVS